LTLQVFCFYSPACVFSYPFLISRDEF
jgi:hypothetical protein